MQLPHTLAKRPFSYDSTVGQSIRGVERLVNVRPALRHLLGSSSFLLITKSRFMNLDTNHNSETGATRHLVSVQSDNIDEE